MVPGRSRPPLPTVTTLLLLLLLLLLSHCNSRRE
jgi:hypothetical protein